MKNEQTIIRVASRSQQPYVMIARKALQDKRLTFEARGILAYLLSKPDDWSLRVKDLQDNGNIGRDKVYRILKELRECGYITQAKYRNDDGTWQSGPYYVFETPQNPRPEKPDTVKPDTVKPEILHITECCESQNFADVDCTGIEDSEEWN